MNGTRKFTALIRKAMPHTKSIYRYYLQYHQAIDHHAISFEYLGHNHKVWMTLERSINFYIALIPGR